MAKRQEAEQQAQQMEEWSLLRDKLAFKREHYCAVFNPRRAR